MRLGAETDGRGQGLTRQHMRTVERTADDAIQQNLPVCLRFQRHEQAFI